MRQPASARSPRPSGTARLKVNALCSTVRSYSSRSHLIAVGSSRSLSNGPSHPAPVPLRKVCAAATADQEPSGTPAAAASTPRNVLSLLGSIPSKVTVTVKNNVVSAKTLFSTARRMVRLPSTASSTATSVRPKKKEQPVATPADFSTLVAPLAPPIRSSPAMVTVPVAAPPSIKSIPAHSWPEHHHHSLHPSLRLVRDRYWSGSQPGARRDNFKLGLVVEGGGMRGIVSGAMLMQLHRMGLRNVFDAVYGASAGAINASYFLAGQADRVDIYTRHINNSDFINLARVFSNQPVMNLDLLVEVMNTTRALDFDAVLNSPIPLKVVASCLDSLGPVLLENFTDKEDLTACLRASANVPQIVGPPCQVRGRRLVDAAVFEPVPYRAALKDGCTHLVVLCTRPRSRSSPFKRQLQHTLVTMLKRTVLNPTYMREAWRRELQMLTHNGMHLDDLLALALEGGEQSDLYRLHGGFIFPVYPGGAAGFPPITTDVATLERGLEEGVQVAQAIFGPLVNLDTQLNQAMRDAKAERSWMQ